MDYGQAAHLFGGYNGGLELVNIVHRLQDNQVGSGLYTRTYGAFKDVYVLLELQIAQRGEHAAERADVERDIPVLKALRGAPGAGYSRGDDLLHPFAEL